MQNIFSIALDGPGGAGKSTIAKAVAKRLGAMYLDTGAMYRTVALYFTRKGLANDPEAVAKLANDMDIGVKFEGGVQRMYLDGEDVTELLRSPEASMAASAVSAVPEVRTRLVRLQQETAKGVSIVMDGRDIGTVVLPDATLKIFITATAEARAMRRYNDLRKAGLMPKFHEVLDELVERDYNDTHRSTTPLRRAEDAYLLDTTNMTIEQVISEVERLLKAAIGG